jgi:hypothetical protein
LPKTTRSRRAIQSGMLPISSAATPEGIVCCAQASAPCPPRKSAPPNTIPAPICFRSIRSPARSPRGSAQARRIIPAVTWRIPMERNGGRSRTAMVTAMKVEPQTR